MADHLTLQWLGVEVLKEGVKFLYGQASEAIKQWREHKKSGNMSADIPSKNTLPAVFENEAQTPTIHINAVGQLETQLDQVCDELSGYVNDRKEVTLEDNQLLSQLELLRQMLETIYRQQLTFKNELRETPALMITGSGEVEEMIDGDIAAVRVRNAQSGAIEGDIKIGRMSGGKATGVEINMNE